MIDPIIPQICGMIRHKRKRRGLARDNQLAIARAIKSGSVETAADTIQKAKEHRDMAIIAGEWAKRKGMGEEAIQHCRSYAFEAERKIGEMLAQTERAKGSMGQLKGKDSSGGISMLPPENNAPTLADFGLTKRESAEAQKLAAMPQDVFESVRDGEVTFSAAMKELRAAEIAAASLGRLSNPVPLHASFR
ncbi:MAG: hypothetical protein HY360_04530, partial [Verrucomicrobia bacterium]|nr:hypothetical protein [Verrucomicrobiota bacterium]